MTTAAQQTAPLDLTLTAIGKQHIGAAVGLHCRRLDELALKARKLGHDDDSRRYESEAEGLRSEIVEPAEEEREYPLYPRHRTAVANGLEAAVINLRSAKGTNSPWKYMAESTAVISRYESEAAEIEARLLPLFKVQGELPLDDVAKKRGEKS